MAKKIIDLIPHIERNNRLAKLRADERWLQVVASFALSGIRVHESIEDVVCRLLDGELSFTEAINEIKNREGFGPPPACGGVNNFV